jgi:hypothetical protein
MLTQTMLPGMFRLRAARGFAALDERLLADIGVVVDRNGHPVLDRPIVAVSRSTSIKRTMIKVLALGGFGIALLGVVLAFATQAAGDDFAGWSDKEVNAALAHARLDQLDQRPDQIAILPCPTIVPGDVAGQIDCGVNEALSASVHAQAALNEAVVSTYWNSQETSTPLPAGFVPIHMDE